MRPYSKYEIELHRIGRQLQKDLPFWAGLKLEQLEIASGFSFGTVHKSLEELEKKGKATSRKTPTGRREHGSIRFKGRIPVRKSI
jgi:predicted transcriptional regulator